MSKIDCAVSDHGIEADDAVEMAETIENEGRTHYLRYRTWSAALFD